jgi:hypothetical protein
MLDFEWKRGEEGEVASVQCSGKSSGQWAEGGGQWKRSAE